MLDQNTDRMWYVIGAVIVGAAIVFILNGTMPQLFASVGETFEDKTNDVTEQIDKLNKNYFDVETAKPGWMLYWATGQEGILDTYANNVISDYIEVEPGDIFRSNYLPHPYFYDEDKQYIGAYHGSSYTITIPDVGSTYQFPDVHVDDRKPVYMRIRYGVTKDNFIQDHDIATIRLTKSN